MMIELSKYELKIDKPGGSDEIDISISNDRDDEILVDMWAVVIDGIMMMFRKDAVDETGDNADIFFDEMKNSKVSPNVTQRVHLFGWSGYKLMIPYKSEATLSAVIRNAGGDVLLKQDYKIDCVAVK